MKLPAALAAGIVLCGAVATAQEGPALDPKSLSAALSVMPAGPDAERLAERIRAYFGGREMLMRGAPARADELSVAFAIEVPSLPAGGPPPRAVADHGMFSLPLKKVGTSGVYAGVASLTHGAAFTWHYEAGGARFG